MNTPGAVTMNSPSSSTKTAMIGKASMRWMPPAAEESELIPSNLLLQLDQIFGELGHRHVLRPHFGNDLPALHDHEPVRHLVHMRQIMFDVDAGVSLFL